MNSNIGSQNSPKKTYKKQKHMCFMKNFSLCPSSQALFDDKSLLFFSKEDFSEIFNFFVYHFKKFDFCKIDDKLNLHDYYLSNFSNEEKALNSFADLENNNLKGCIKLTLEKKIVKKKLQTYKIEKNEFYITSGVYVFPEASCLLHKYSELIKGYMLDTTWRLFSQYVTSILTACLFNTSLPIAFAWGHGESKALYTFLLNTVEEIIDYDFHNKVFESDQGSSLKGLFKDYSIKHLYCLRHFLSCLKYKDYSYELSTLIRCTSEFEFDNSKIVFGKNFNKIIEKNPDELENINKALKKIGLTFSNKLIKIENQEKWEKVSMLQRIGFQMPSTTNSLEATHGHLNKRTPRRNKFYTAFDRVCKNLDAKYLSINDRISHNFNYLKNKTKKKLSKTSTNTMNQLCAFYDTTEDKCLCSENKLESSNYDINIPCYHRLFKGSAFPKKPTINLELDLQFENLEIKTEIIQSNETQVSELIDQINYATRTIMHFSHYKNEDEIRNFVQENTREEESCFFILNQKVSLIELIEEGIVYFKDKKGRNK